MDCDGLGRACECGHEAGDILLPNSRHQPLLWAPQHLLALEKQRRRHERYQALLGDQLEESIAGIEPTSQPRHDHRGIENVPLSAI